MRVLAVGNMYPPHHLGGYELVWEAAVRHLRERGHQVSVLTTDFRLEDVETASEPNVHRELRWYWRDHSFPRLGPLERLRLERHNAEVFERQRSAMAPDVLSWWAMGGMSLSLIERGREAGLPSVGFVHDDWMVYGPRVDAWLRMAARLPRSLRRGVQAASGIPTEFEPGPAGRWLFVSEQTRRTALESGVDLEQTGVAHSGIDASLFRAAPREETDWRWRLLYVGRLDPRKGPDLAVEALAELPPESTLTVVGRGDPAVIAALVATARRLGVHERVQLRSAERSELPGLYGEADAVLFPVRWPEPWGLVPLEAMAVGTPVVASGRGGSAEYLKPEENCLLADPDAGGAALADATRRLAADPRLRAKLRRGGRETAAGLTEERFNETVERALDRAAGRAGP